MDFSIALAWFENGSIGIRQLPDVALSALEQGYDSPSLRILAGLSDIEDAWKIEAYFSATLRELALTLPEKRCAALLVAKAISEECISGNRPVFEGVQKLLDEVINRYPFEQKNKKYAYDGIGFNEVYGLFDSLDELPFEAAWPWQKPIPYAAQVAALEQELLLSLHNWQAWLDAELKKC